MENWTSDPIWNASSDPIDPSDSSDSSDCEIWDGLMSDVRSSFRPKRV